MARRSLNAEEITAIIFDPIVQQQPKKSLMMNPLGILFGTKQPCEVSPATEPEEVQYRSLDGAFDHLIWRGVPSDACMHLRNGIESLMTTAICELEKTMSDFSRRRDVMWNDGTAYLGLRIQTTDAPELLDFCPEAIAGVRESFARDLQDMMDNHAALFIAEEESKTAMPPAHIAAQAGIHRPSMA